MHTCILPLQSLVYTCYAGFLKDAKSALWFVCRQTTRDFIDFATLHTSILSLIVSSVPFWYHSTRDGMETALEWHGTWSDSPCCTVTVSVPSGPRMEPDPDPTSEAVIEISHTSVNQYTITVHVSFHSLLGSSYEGAAN